ncbi:hypothetical protein COCSUDRAFT_46842 [Coccomyxa subellipsoidea C-169]|uniref:Uncharacterized protein n=1 Tax=Coccomyxa subellipsoidea (strain C-169) TaxID=574566 RepID=I0Z1L9_COCSC|nr:hypothetical protein COCSUDRAFT_46842 [Coccomyxa subellipsoidea C-169]EIE24538.1 hypothetical protein COCSUDRAFT_46842 [Coccomyxa subellipsoidea C-169]|eukprot:XP_005649082.1 hypothetical protein COCSUDRAFT_46842 [Coccomyxa subellipsoidea C-169]
MKMLGLQATLRSLVFLVCAGALATGARTEGGRRALQQATIVGATSVPAPAGTRTLYSLHGVGTQNYTAQQNGTYLNIGAVADLYDGTTKTARHFFDANDKATWVIFDPATGAVQGTVQGTVKAKAARQRQVDDGGFGSVDALLLTATQGTGVLKGATYIQRLNPLGGALPTGLFGLPAYADKIPNYDVAVPYQADYVFLAGGLPYGEGGRRRMAHFQKRLHHPLTPDGHD